MKQTVIKWESKQDYSGPDDLNGKLKELLEDNLTIVQVIPTVYADGGVLRITDALIIVVRNGISPNGVFTESK